MSVLLVTYDLRKPGRNYDGLYEALERWTRCHALDSVWFLDTSDTPKTVRDVLCAQMDDGDQLYVFRLRQHWATWKKDGCTMWLKAQGRTWD